jgi:DNA processing protein
VVTSRTPLRIGPGSPDWPRELLEIEGAPEALWLRGQIEILGREPRIAIVGTRAPTPYGEAQAARFASALSLAGVSVVSGMARGIDQAAHRATLREGGSTIAVLGSGVDVPWPTGAIAEEIAEHGLLLSEFHPGEPPKPHHFPMRNRVISGLCRGVLVVEAAQASGSLITARWAADQGRSVWALPGRVDHPMSRGVHRLLREGAALVEDPDEILRDLGVDVPSAVESTSPPAEASPTARKILEALRGETLSAAEISARLGRPLTSILVEVVALEMAGRAARTPGGLYRRLGAGE